MQALEDISREYAEFSDDDFWVYFHLAYTPGYIPPEWTPSSKSSNTNTKQQETASVYKPNHGSKPNFIDESGQTLSILTDIEHSPLPLNSNWNYHINTNIAQKHTASVYEQNYGPIPSIDQQRESNWNYPTKTNIKQNYGPIPNLVDQQRDLMDVDSNWNFPHQQPPKLSENENEIVAPKVISGINMEFNLNGDVQSSDDENVQISKSENRNYYKTKRGRLIPIKKTKVEKQDNDEDDEDDDEDDDYDRKKCHDNCLRPNDPQKRMVECPECDMWWHKECAGLTDQWWKKRSINSWQCKLCVKDPPYKL